MAASPIGQYAAGVLHTLWLTLEMLDEKGVLPREESHAWLAGHLDASKVTGPIKIPLTQLVEMLGKPKGQPVPKGRSGWLPTVYDGDKPDD